ncbi:MAG TPA: FAD-dependent monooxygenase, partial [bacterium]|nr:FAD-dependent monooxygenase [bacterium]
PEGTGVTLRSEGRAGWALPRRTLDQILLAHAANAGVRVHQDASAVAVERDGGRTRVTVAHRGTGATETHAAALVMGADGLRSTVARAAGLGGPPHRGRYTVGTYLEGLLPLEDAGGEDVGEIHLRHDRYCGVAYLPGGVANVTLALRRDELRAWRGAVEAGYWASLRGFPALSRRLARARRVDAVAATGPLAYWRRRCVADGIMLVGDAAAYIDPLTGQGVYLALRGAEMAAAAALRALDRTGPRREILGAYERERRRELWGVFVISRILQALAFRPGVAARTVRRLAARPELGAALIAAIGNFAAPGSVLRAGFLARALGMF